MRIIKRVVIWIIIIFSLLASGIYTLLYNKYFPPILMYHNITGHDTSSKLSVSPDSFERQIRFIARHYNSVTVLQLAEMVKSKSRLPKATIAVTFDDGYENNYTNAFPILKKYNVKATIFLIVDKIARPGYLNLAQIKEMNESGLIDFGSHTISHANLTEIQDNDAWQEIYYSKTKLENMLGWEIKVFSYPGGGFNHKIKEMVKKAGYICAVATAPGEKFPNDNIYSLKRVRVSRSSDNLWVFWLYSSGYYTWIKEMRDEE